MSDPFSATEWTALPKWQRRFFALLLERHPFLTAHLRFDDWNGSRFAIVEAPRPVGAHRGSLWITVDELGPDECEATIGLLYWHGHYGLGGTDLAELAAPDHWFWTTLSDILEERLVLCFSTVRGSYLGGVLLPLQEALAGDPGAPSLLPRGEGWSIRSWRGTHDRDEPAAASPS